MASLGDGNWVGGHGASRTPPPQNNSHNLGQSSLAKSSSEATRSEASQSRSITRSQSHSHSKTLSSLPVNSRKEAESPQDLWQKQMRRERETKGKQGKGKKNNKKNNKNSDNNNRLSAEKNDKNENSGKKMRNTSLVDFLMSNFVSSNTNNNSNNNNNNNNNTNKGSNHTVNKSDMGYYHGKRRIFEDMDTDDSEISDFEVIVTPPYYYGRMRSKSKRKSSRKHRRHNEKHATQDKHDKHDKHEKHEKRETIETEVKVEAQIGLSSDNGALQAQSGGHDNDTDIVIVDDDYVEKVRNSGLGLGLGLATVESISNNNNNNNSNNNNHKPNGILMPFRRVSRSRSRSQSQSQCGNVSGDNNSGQNTPVAQAIAQAIAATSPMAFNLTTPSPRGTLPPSPRGVAAGGGSGAGASACVFEHAQNASHGLTTVNSAPIPIGLIKTKGGQIVGHGSEYESGVVADYQRMHSGSCVFKPQLQLNESRSDRDAMNGNSNNSRDREASHSQSQSQSQSESSVRVSISDYHGADATVYYAQNVKSPLYYNQNSKCDDIVVSKFKHSRPIAGTEYFQELSGIKDGLSIVIPFFNETANELEITLKTLYYSYQYLCFKLPDWEKKPFNVCIIQDGWSKAHVTMQRYLKKMFPKKIYDLEQKMDQLNLNGNSNNNFNNSNHHYINSSHNNNNNNHNDNNISSVSSFCGVPNLDASNLDGKFWWDYYDEFTKYDVAKQGSTTFIIEKTLDNPTFFQIRFKKDPQTKVVNEKFKGPKHQLKMNLTVIIKIDNRRKHNSHEWFMGKDGFADAAHSKYFLATDAFTIFDKKCLYYLVNYMEKNPKCCACTGRQRAMSRRQQGLREREWILSMEYILRQTQRCDFELSTCVYNPAFSIFGFLPVIPGPCGMYRCEDALQDEARNWYFDVINASPSETGLVLGNLRIAEDRVLSYASILKLKKTRFMAFVDSAVFYFEAETNLDTFLYQRRRWINGTFAGYWFLLVQHPSHLWNWKASIIRRFFVWILLWVCLFQMIAVAISPSISFTILQEGIRFLLSKANGGSGDEDTIVPVIMGIVWIAWIAHVIVHNKKKFQPIIMHFLFLLSVFTSLSFAASYFILFVIERKTIQEALIVDGMPEHILNGILMLMALAAACPIINNFLISADFHGVWVLLRSFFAYFLSFHMMIPWFASYSFARCWDLSWGNRPTSEEHGASGDGSQNQGSDLDLIETKVDIADLKKAKFLQYSTYVGFGLIVMNFSVYFLPRYWKALLMSGILITGVLFMVLSTLVLALKFPMKIYERYIEPCLCQRRTRKRLAQRRNDEDDE